MHDWHQFSLTRLYEKSRPEEKYSNLALIDSGLYIADSTKLCIVYIQKKTLICIFFFSVSLQGFTAAQLSTESVSKLLSEEPSAQAGADLEYQLLEAAKAGKKILEPWVFLPRASLYSSGP